MKWTIADDYELDEVLRVFTEDRHVYALEPRQDGQYRLAQATAWDGQKHVLGAYRPVEPLKSLFFRPREFLGTLAGPGATDDQRECIVVGVKSCDLSSLAVHDHVSLHGGFRDSRYADARDRTIIVSADCTGFLDVCFCPVVGEQPYPMGGFDINISPTPEGYVFETGTERGARVLASAQHCLKPADDALLEVRDKQRAALYDKLVAHQVAACGLKPGDDLRAAVDGAYESRLWSDFAADCVECGACNFICCTCHCFLLADGTDAKCAPARTKQWDSCLFAGFARTAGGPGPRPYRSQRLRNRFEKKFVFFPEVIGKYACDGCGRCTEACIGKIDIRDVLKRALDESNAIHAGAGPH